MIILTRSTSPWTEIEDRVETLPWVQRNFPLSEEELKDLEVSIWLDKEREEQRSDRVVIFRLRRGWCRATG